MMIERYFGLIVLMLAACGSIGDGTVEQYSPDPDSAIDLENRIKGEADEDEAGDEWTYWSVPADTCSRMVQEKCFRELDDCDGRFFPNKSFSSAAECAFDEQESCFDAIPKAFDTAIGEDCIAALDVSVSGSCDDLDAALDLCETATAPLGCSDQASGTGVHTINYGSITTSFDGFHSPIPVCFDIDEPTGLEVWTAASGDTSGLDTVILLISPEGWVWDFNDNDPEGDGGYSRIHTQVDFTGQWTAIAASYDESISGPVEFGIKLTEGGDDPFGPGGGPGGPGDDDPPCDPEPPFDGPPCDDGPPPF